MDNGITHVLIELTPKEIQGIKGIYSTITGNDPESLDAHLQGFCNMLVRYAIDELSKKGG